MIMIQSDHHDSVPPERGLRMLQDKRNLKEGSLRKGPRGRALECCIF